MAAKKKGDYTEILIRQGVISPDQLAEAQEMADSSGMKLVDALIRLDYATGEEVMRAVAEQEGRDYVNLSEVVIPPAVVELVPESVARENAILPLAEEDGTLKVIVSDPYDFETFDKLNFILNRHIEIALAPREAILEAINRHYGQTVGESADSMLQEFTDTAIDFTETEEEAAAGEEEIDESSAPIVRLVQLADQRGGAAPRLGHPHRAVRGPNPSALSYRRRAGRAGQPPPASCWGPSCRVSRFCRSSTSPSGGGPRTGGSRPPWGRRNSTFG